MRKVTLVRGARQLLTLRGPSGPRRGADLGNLGIIQDGAVLIVDGLILEVGPSRRLENLALARGAQEIDASGRVVMPGFADSHMHLVSGPIRAADYEAPTIGASDGPAVARTIHELSPRALRALALRVVQGAVRHGTTAMEAKSGLGLSEAGELKILRVQAALRKQQIPLVSTYLSARVPPVVHYGADAYLEWSCTHWLPMVRRRKLAEFADIRCEEGAFTPEQAVRYLTVARELGLGVKMSTGERSHPGAIAAAVELAASSVSPVVNVTERDALLLGRSPTIATLQPGAAFHLGTARQAPARMLIDGGAAVALATGYHPETSPSENMQMTIALACRALKMTAAEAIVAATINGAHAMRRGGSIGSLEAGKSADLLILGVPDYRELPYHFGVNIVDSVMSGGTLLAERPEVKWPVL